MGIWDIAIKSQYRASKAPLIKNILYVLDMLTCVLQPVFYSNYFCYCELTNQKTSVTMEFHIAAAYSTTPHDNLKILSESKPLDVEILPGGNFNKEDEHCMPKLPSQSPPVHCFLFGADCVSVNTSGRVLVATFPVIPFVKDDPTCVRDVPPKDNDLPVNCASWISPLQYDKLNGHFNANVEVTDSGVTRLRNKWMMASPLSMFDSRGQILHRIKEPFLHTPNSEDKLIDSEWRVAETPAHMEMETKNSLFTESNDDLKDMELSPRLTIYVEKGVVPESPVVEKHSSSSTMEHKVCKDFNAEIKSGLRSDYCIRNMDMTSSQGEEPPITEHILPDIQTLSTGPTSRKIILENEMVSILHHADEGNIEMGILSASPIKEIQTPLVNKQDHSSCEDWKLSSGEAPKSIQQPQKFKRLCKYLDIGRRLASKTSKEALSSTRASLCRSLNRTKFSPMKHVTGTFYFNFFLL